MPEMIESIRPILLSLNCLILGESQDHIFPIDTSVDCIIGVLQELIKNKNFISLGKVDGRHIALWNVSFPIDEFSSKDPITLGPKSRSDKKLSNVFLVGTKGNVLHIIARVPGIGPPLSSRPPPTAYRFSIASTDQVVKNRQNFCEKRKPEAPSAGGAPRRFLDNQSNDDTHIPCGRPYSYSTALPVTLLHPVFGEFMDDCKDYVPTPADVQFLHDFVETMANIHTLEDDRKQELLQVFEKYRIYMKSTMTGSCSTDAHLSYTTFPMVIAKLKNENGFGGEPYFQVILCYLEATPDLAAQYPISVLPCIILLIVGPYIAFASATWTDRPTIQTLSPATPCHYHNADINMENTLVRHLGAFRRAIRSLGEYYRQISNSSRPWRNPTLPYPASFKSRGGSLRHFEYFSQMEGCNVYFGNLDDDVDGHDDSAICVKFSTRYCREAHEVLALKGCAPRLHAVERLPGGMYMVLMKDLSHDYVSLFNFIQEHPDVLSEGNETVRSSFSEKVRQNISELHQAGFVHGDIRDTNIMVKKSGLDDASFLVVDYDFSGEINKVRYPLDLNTTTVRRPKGATGGGLIDVDHDLEMLNDIWAF